MNSDVQAYRTVFVNAASSASAASMEALLPCPTSCSSMAGRSPECRACCTSPRMDVARRRPSAQTRVARPLSSENAMSGWRLSGPACLSVRLSTSQDPRAHHPDPAAAPQLYRLRALGGTPGGDLGGHTLATPIVAGAIPRRCVVLPSPNCSSWTHTTNSLQSAALESNLGRHSAACCGGSRLGYLTLYIHGWLCGLVRP
jgi:hypothetical protein